MIFITDPKKIKLENDFRGVTPVQVSNRFQAGYSDFSVTIQEGYKLNLTLIIGGNKKDKLIYLSKRKAEFKLGQQKRRFLVTDAVGNYAFLEIGLEHHDLQRILAYGDGQKVIISSVEASCAYITTRSPMEISLVEYFCHGSRIKFDLNFNDYSRCKLPLDNSNSSKLNIVTKIKGKFDSFCEQK